ncbi:GTP 3',8-cyclase MoaA [Brevundimonas aveniformis]|uniref:GTP 3',8-cyclase MoaA n=1 Tax=Brevundimonas aveniformis TaxID=370977 RepID=UPI002491BB62|nr:GTP 3',8-cyclase MoaA [Brevundimonas aveniformis]
MAFGAGHLADGFGRRFRYLRLSVTEVCNFRCTYCLPDGWKKTAPLSFLTPDEIARLIGAFADLGLAKVRLTGGEPTVRKDFADIIARTAAVSGVGKVAVTTNGWNLIRQIDSWKAAGLTHLNLSLDALEPEAFQRITGHDRLVSILTGLDRALELDLQAVKINAVLLRDTGERGFEDWAEFVRHRPVSVRFIELMRTADNLDFFNQNHVGGGVLRDWLEQRGWTPVDRPPDGGPAQEYSHPDYAGRLGLIAPYAPGFCDSCNRLRVTARGKLRLCLFGEGGVDLRDLLIDDDQRPDLIERIRGAMSGKRLGHLLAQGNPGDLGNLAQLGG